jgi:hypothetical protein
MRTSFKSVPVPVYAGIVSGPIRRGTMSSSLRRLVRCACVVAILSFGLAAGCNQIASKPSDPTTMEMVVGPAGGTVTSPDGVQIVVPAGALDSDVVLTVTKMPAPAQGAPQEVVLAGNLYELGPEGTTFKSPVTVSFPIVGAPANGHVATLLFSAPKGSSDWTVVPAQVDGKILRAQTLHFSWWTGAYWDYGEGCHIQQDYPCSTNDCRYTMLESPSILGLQCFGVVRADFPASTRCTCLPDGREFNSALAQYADAHFWEMQHICGFKCPEVPCAPTETTCGTKCCPAGVACGATQNSCACAPTEKACGTACCPAAAGCGSTPNTCAQCASNETVCGTSCCAAGVGCGTAPNTCAQCAPPQTVCGTACCTPGTTCGTAPNTCGKCDVTQTTCGTTCCPGGIACGAAPNTCACAPTEKACGTKCCGPNQTCGATPNTCVSLGDGG